MFARVLLVTIAASTAVAELQEVFKWKELEFEWPNEEVKDQWLQRKDYIPSNNLPLGLDRWRDKLFVTVPRWKAGVAASLTYIPLQNSNESPALVPYPNWESNTLSETNVANNSKIVSTFRVRVDPCDRLWVMDTGVSDIVGEFKVYTKPTIVVFDLNTDSLIRRYEFKDTDVKESSFFANIVVDVTPDKCEEAFAYILDLGGYGIVVYSWAENDSWRVKHNYFHFDPLQGDLHVGGVNFQWTDGVFGLALGKIDENGNRPLYFHPLVSTKEFVVSTEVLKNQTVATDPHSYNLYSLLGDKGNITQSSASDYDIPTNVLFETQLSRDGVACWKSTKPLNSDNFALVANDKERLIFTNDLKIDFERNLWILSDRMPVFLYQGLDPESYNYRIFKIPVDEAIRSSACE